MSDEETQPTIIIDGEEVIDDLAEEYDVSKTTKFYMYHPPKRIPPPKPPGEPDTHFTCILCRKMLENEFKIGSFVKGYSCAGCTLLMKMALLFQGLRQPMSTENIQRLSKWKRDMTTMPGWSWGDPSRGIQPHVRELVPKKIIEDDEPPPLQDADAPIRSYVSSPYVSNSPYNSYNRTASYSTSTSTTTVNGQEVDPKTYFSDPNSPFANSPISKMFDKDGKFIGPPAESGGSTTYTTTTNGVKGESYTVPSSFTGDPSTYAKPGQIEIIE